MPKRKAAQGKTTRRQTSNASASEDGPLDVHGGSDHLASSPRRHRRNLGPFHSSTQGGRGVYQSVAAAPESAPGGPSNRSKRRRGSKEGTAHDGDEIYARDVLQHMTRMHSLDVAGPPARRTSKIMEAVVKVFCTHCEPHFSLPWQRRRQCSSSGSGFIIPGRRILTNAHCVDYYAQVKVKRRGSDTKYVASVLAIGDECDIALLTVDDDDFWTDISPVAFGELPHLQDSVSVCGFPIGGDTLSVTSGVISRIETLSYVHGSAELLGVQIDAAINSGNSGGPAFDDRGRVIGIAFQSMAGSGDAENISYIIPTPVVNHFIDDFERNGRYTGFPSLGVEWQRTESPALREALGMARGQRGIYVRRVEPTSSASGHINPGDVLLEFDGVAIGTDGTVPFRTGERIAFSHLISQKMTGETAEVCVLSKGKRKRLMLEMRPINRLIPVHINQKPPKYYIVGGLVFTPVTVPLLRAEFGKEFDYDAPIKLLDKMLYGMKKNETQEIVVLSQVLAADVNVGYEDFSSMQVMKANGHAINNLAELVHIIDSSTDRFLRLELEYDHLLVLDLEAARKATLEILEQHCIAQDRSIDLRAMISDSDLQGRRRSSSRSTRTKKPLTAQKTMHVLSKKKNTH